MSNETLVRVTAPDFCAGAVYINDGQLCIMAADKLANFIGRGLHKLEQDARRNRWTIDKL